MTGGHGILWGYTVIYLVAGFKHGAIIVHFIKKGMSSFPVTNSIIFQDGEIAPPISYNANSGLINHGLLIVGTFQIVTIWYLNGIPPIKQP